MTSAAHLDFKRAHGSWLVWCNRWNRWAHVTEEGRCAGCDTDIRERIKQTDEARVAS